MPQFSAEAIARFEEVLQKDPNSQAFAPLAEAYRTEHRLMEADRVATEGVRRHPQFASGWVTYGKILRDLKRLPEALEAFSKAAQLAPENLLALQLLGEIQLEAKRPKEALKIFKRILFLNPQAEKARKIIAKLESLTADEYEEDLFAMTKLTAALTAPSGSPMAAKPAPGAADQAMQTANKATQASKGLQRMLSLIDAFIVRNDLQRALQLTDETFVEFGDNPEIQQRRLILQRRRGSQLGLREEMSEPLAPLASREEQIRRRKIQTLQALLRRIEQVHT